MVNRSYKVEEWEEKEINQKVKLPKKVSAKVKKRNKGAAYAAMPPEWVGKEIKAERK